MSFINYLLCTHFSELKKSRQLQPFSLDISGHFFVIWGFKSIRLNSNLFRHFYSKKYEKREEFENLLKIKVFDLFLSKKLNIEIL